MEEVNGMGLRDALELKDLAAQGIEEV